MIYKLHESPSESSKVNGYRVIVIQPDKGKSTFNERSPSYFFVNGKVLPEDPEGAQIFAEELTKYLPVLEYIPPKTNGDYEWIRLSSMGQKVKLWMSSRNTPGFAKGIIGKEHLFWWEGLVRLSDLRVVYRSECFVKIEKRKIYFKGLLFLPDKNQDFNTTKFEDYPGFNGKKSV